MPIDIRYEENGTWVVVTGRGTVTGQEVIAVNDEIYAPERLARQECQLIDLTGVDGVEVSSGELRQLAAADRAAVRSNPRIRIAVAGNRDVVYGVARMWEAFAQDVHIPPRVFRTVDEAKAWLLEQAQG